MEISNKNSTAIQTSFEQKGDIAKFDTITEKRIKTLAELIAIAEVDTDIWDVEKWVCNKWEVAGIDRSTNKFMTTDLWQVKATFKKRVEAIMARELTDIMVKELKKHSPKVPRRKFKRFSEPCLAEVDLFDPHIGQLVWGLETGKGNYDLKIAEETYLGAISEMISRFKPYNVERILFPIGNDFFNVNGTSGATFNDTPQHEDARWQKTFRTGVNLLRKSIEMLSAVAPVDIVVVTGNHDTEPIFYAGEILSAVYANDKNVTVDDGPTQRKYYQYGLNLIGLTHGKYEKHSELPIIMANECKEMWKETIFREWHIGHYHHKKEYQFLSAQEFKGVTVRILRALTETDAWHTSRGYIGSQRAAEGFIWHKKHGLICNLSVNI